MAMVASDLTERIKTLFKKKLPAACALEFKDYNQAFIEAIAEAVVAEVKRGIPQGTVDITTGKFTGARID